jgi:uncharacterized protein YjbI with pentapeptide repeats
MPQRLSYEESCRALQGQGLMDEGEVPPIPDHSPRNDDEILGVSFFRTMLADVTMEHMTLPRTFFGRSEIRTTSFCGTDLSGSTANWNDFIDVDFGSSDLSGSDFRACVFERVQFTGATLANVDFRHCIFRDCDFASTDMDGAKFTTQSGASLRLLSEQQRVIDWQASDGEEPDGG